MNIFIDTKSKKHFMKATREILNHSFYYTNLSKIWVCNYLGISQTRFYMFLNERKYGDDYLIFCNNGSNQILIKLYCLCCYLKRFLIIRKNICLFQYKLEHVTDINYISRLEFKIFKTTLEEFSEKLPWLNVNTDYHLVCLNDEEQKRYMDQYHLIPHIV